MNSDETWLLYLFSGLFGAVISGVVAAIVAVLLLRNTNQHVSNEAVKNTTEQRRLAALETKAAEARADKALTAQREGLELQLSEQKRQSSLARKVDAAAELASTIRAIPTLLDGSTTASNAINRSGLQARSAALRWIIEDDDIELALCVEDFIVEVVMATLKLDAIRPVEHSAGSRFHHLTVLSNDFANCVVHVAKTAVRDDQARPIRYLEELIEKMRQELG